MANYALIALILYEEEENKNDDTLTLSVSGGRNFMRDYVKSYATPKE